MIRFLILYVLYLKQKIKDFGQVKYNGFTVYYAFKNSEISLGKGCVVNSGSLSNLLGLYQRTIIIARYGGRIKIGKNAAISGSTIYSMSEIRIGDNFALGANCKIIDSDFHALDFEIRTRNRPNDIKKGPILIGDNCFIGLNSIILKGTTIGNNSVVGAGSVVCGSFPANVILAGNPAKIIKYLVLD